MTPVEVRAQRVDDLAADLRAVARAVDGLSLLRWEGPAAVAFRAQLREVRDHAAASARAADVAADALRAHAAAVQEAARHATAVGLAVPGWSA